MSEKLIRLADRLDAWAVNHSESRTLLFEASEAIRSFVGDISVPAEDPAWEQLPFEGEASA